MKTDNAIAIGFIAFALWFMGIATWAVYRTPPTKCDCGSICTHSKSCGLTECSTGQ